MKQLIKIYQLNLLQFNNIVKDIFPRNALLRILVGIIFLAILIGVMLFEYMLYTGVNYQLGIEAMIFIQYAFTGFVCLIVSMITVSSKLIYNQNFELFAVLPIKIKIICISNLFSILLPLISIQIFVLIPSIISLYSIRRLTASIIFNKVIYTILITGYSFLMISILIGLFQWIRIKSKRLFVVLPIITVTISTILVLIVNFFRNTPLQNLNSLDDAFVHFFAILQKIFFINRTISDMTIRQFFSENILCIGVISLSCYIAVQIVIELFSKLIFMQSLTSMETRSRVKLKRGRGNNLFSKLIMRELWIIRSEAHFISTTVMEIALLPILTIVIVCIFKIGSTYNEAILQALELMNRFEYKYQIIISVMLMVVNLQSNCLVPVSREGKNFCYSRILPISYAQQYLAKTIFIFITSTISISISFGIIFISSIVELNYGLLIYLFVLSAELIMVSFCSAADFKKPYLDWDEPRKATNSNLNIIFGMGRVFLTFIFVLPLFSVTQFVEKYVPQIISIEIILFGVIAYLIIKKRCLHIGKSYQKIFL
jgi:ABC-2 type transport system permease protein